MNEMEEHVGDLEERLNMKLKEGDESDDEGCINVEDEGSAHQTYDKSESVKSITIGKIIGEMHTQNSQSDYPGVPAFHNSTGQIMENNSRIRGSFNYFNQS